MKRLATLTGILLALFVPLTALAADAPAASAVKQLLALELPDEQGKKIAIRQWKGRVLVVNFWATWCAPCKAEIPEFSRLHTAWQKKGVQFVGIAIDKRENVQVFVDEIKVSYPQLIDNGKMMQSLRALGNDMQGLPFTLLIDKKGELLARHLGSMETKELEALLKTATARPRKAAGGKH
ncbi:MAG: TlpA family protein disulfide reductase [Zoogloeaceae bacterium]|jgi:thiol-disulfide isomerase/thioredoxin|nr:TlpA family protein disulfide reductase [Zoogloeaceae bacterium]